MNASIQGSVSPRGRRASMKTVGQTLHAAMVLFWWTVPALQTANAQSGGDYVIAKRTIDSGRPSNRMGATAGQPDAADLVGGDYVVTKSTIASGGGEVTGGACRLNGTIGQHDAGNLAGGDYFLSGGFWSSSAPVDNLCPPAPDTSGFNKCRFISFVPCGQGGSETALRVVLVSLHHVNPPYTGGASVPFTSFEGQVRWVGPPVQYVESVSSGLTFYASQLQCDPYYQDWSTVGLLHVTGSAIVPSSVYEVENLAASCQGNEASCTAVSSPLSISTTRWGDVVDPFNPPSTTTQPDFGDIGALVNKFKSAVGAPIKARALLAGTNANGVVDPSPDLGFTHISACVDAFKGLPYPYTIASCP